MEEANSLSPAELATIQASMLTVGIGPFGSLATLPLFCLGELVTPDVHGTIDEHHAKWCAALLVVRETLRNSPGISRLAAPSLDVLEVILNDLRASYHALADFKELGLNRAMSGFGRLVASYGQLSPRVEICHAIVGVDTTAYVKRMTDRQNYYKKTLNWFGEEIHARLATLPDHHPQPRRITA